ncbi:unnamed protein product [Trichobilharzia szidati]|nr:unnamed protein product [Trichobilharzia szidati]
MSESTPKRNSKTNELETVTEEPTVKSKTSELPENDNNNNDNSTNSKLSQRRNSRLDSISKAQGVKRLSLSRYSTTGQVQPQTPASCPNRSPLSCLNVSINGPISAVETNKVLTFQENDCPTAGGGGGSSSSRKISQYTPSLSSTSGPGNRPPLSMLSILAAKRITRKFLSTFTDDKYHRRLSTFSRLSSVSPAPYNLISMLPTYQLGPKEVFNITSIQPRVEQLVQSRLESLPKIYDDKRASRLCITLTNEIKSMLRNNGKDRYRYLVYGLVMQNNKQLAGFTSRVLWDMNYDRTFCVTVNNSTYCISLACFIVYKE